MKIFKICCLSIFMILLFVNVWAKVEERFKKVYRQKFHFNMNHAEIIEDTYTGKQYLFYKNGYAGGLTLLIEED